MNFVIRLRVHADMIACCVLNVLPSVLGQIELSSFLSLEQTSSIKRFFFFFFMTGYSKKWLLSHNQGYGYQYIYMYIKLKQKFDRSILTLTAGNTLCYFLFFPIYLIRNNSGDYNPSI